MSGRPRVLYEDDHLLIVDKPAGVVVHPTYRNMGGTLLDWIRARAPEPTPSIVGRLDKGTSGLVVVARGREAHARLQRAMADDACEKEYLALVEGAVAAGSEIALPLRVDPDDRRRVIVSEGDGSRAVTRFEPLASTTTHSLLRCRLMTGRRHQIRAHLAAIGHPIVGDPRYGASDDGIEPSRPALHAWRIAIDHPFTGTRLSVEAPTPDDLRTIVTRAGIHLP